MKPELTHTTATEFYTEEEANKYAKSNHYRKTQSSILDYILNALLIDERLFRDEDPECSNSQSNEFSSYDENSKMSHEEKFSSETKENDKNSKSENCKEIQEILTVLDLGIGPNTYHDVYDELKNISVFGVDVSGEMLRLASPNIQSSYINSDISQNWCFRPGTFDLVISVSCIQWLFTSSNPRGLERNVQELIQKTVNVLKRNGVGVFQFHFTDDSLNGDDVNTKNSKGDKEIHRLINTLKRTKINYKLVSDSQSRKRKIFLILWMDNRKIGEIIDESICFPVSDSLNDSKNTKLRLKPGRFNKKEWIERKKRKAEGKGFKVPKTSKYSGRRRKH